ncbi:MAG: glycosyltransferase [Firmicutes bacterium]|nr:glycosyltransferase [Bacillota bacterium]
MIIGLTNNNQSGKQKISNFIEKKYGFKYIDIDKVLENILKEKFYLDEFNNCNWKDNISFLLNIRNEIDKRINNIVKNHPNEVIVLDYSLLEDTYIFNNCDILIKNISNNSIDNTSEIEMVMNDRKNSIHAKYDNSKYHIELDMDSDWENKLEEYINFNINNDTKVTVVVPIYNTCDYLPKCINSITNQTYRNLEIILINDGSTDESLKICNFLAEKDNRVKVVTQKNMGLSETRNRGMELATGEYICFIDSDDYIEKEMIETLLKTAKKTNADVCESSFYIHMKDGNIKDVSCEQKGIKFVEGKLDLINSYSDATILIPAWDKLYKLSAIKDFKFDKNCFKEDSDYIYRLCMAEKTFALVNIPFYHYIKRKSVSLTGNKISDRLFTLQDWGKEAYKNTLALGEEYRDAAEKILYNSLVHILRNYMRDYKNNILKENEFKDEIQNVVNDIISLLLKAKNVKKFRKLDEVLSIINELKDDNVIEKDKMPSIELPCVGILWNSLSKEMIEEAMKFIKERATINECVSVDLKDKYREFINEIYLYNNEFEGIPVIKSGTLIDRYDSNTIVILNLIVKVSNYLYFNKLKGFMFEEIAELKSFIRKYFKYKIRDYAYDNIFHLTVDDEEYEYTDEICKKYIKDYRGIKNGKQ